MNAAKLEPADARRVHAILHALDTIRLDGRRTPWPDVVRETRAVLDTEHLWCFQPRMWETGWEVPVWYGDGSLSAAHARFADALATGPREWAWFRPTCPAPRQRNRFVEALSSAARAQPGFFEESHLYRRFFRPLHLHRHRQLRVLLCDGARLLAWFGALQPQPITERQRAIANMLVSSLQRRLLIDERLAEASTVARSLEAVLEHLGVAAFVVGRRAEILHANAVARATLEVDCRAALVAKVLGA